MHAVNVDKKCARCDTLSDLLHLTDSHFLQFFFSLLPAQKSSRKTMQQLLKLCFTHIYLVRETFSWCFESESACQICKKQK